MKRILIVLFFLSTVLQTNAQLIINEVSQGPSGSKEYVELLVYGTPVCDSQTIDIRGWIIDDNNGWHAGGSGTGIAAGHKRFANLAQWASVRMGSLILIYNETDRNALIPADDTADSNHDCVYILPGSSRLFDHNTDVPSAPPAVFSTYSGAAYGATGTWSSLAMANGDDAFHVVKPDSINWPYFAVGWGNNTALTNVYFAGAADKKIMHMVNTIDNNPFNPANYRKDTIIVGSSPETPGAPNNLANAGWINAMKHSCLPFTRTTIVKDTSICRGRSILAGGALRSIAGTYYDTLRATIGCDTIKRTNLSILPPPSVSRNISICTGDSILLGGRYRNSAGTYYDTLHPASSCDSILATNLSILIRLSGTRSVTICNGDSILLGGIYRRTGGAYFDTLHPSGSCDSILTTNLNIAPRLSGTRNQTICAGDSYFAGGASQTRPGIYYDTLHPVGSCDSVVQTILLVINPSLHTDSVRICNGDRYYAGGAWQISAGTYYDTLISWRSCDSILTTVLILKPIRSAIVNRVICQGDSYYAGGAMQSTPGIYFDTLTSSISCDSILQTNLSLNRRDSISIDTNICIGQVYNGTRIYADTLLRMMNRNVFGCDSIVEVNVNALPAPAVNAGSDTNINYGETAQLLATGALSYLWSNGLRGPLIFVNPTLTTTYMVTGSNANGCEGTDSVTVFIRRIDDLRYFAIPDAFTPNGDGLNDRFNIVGRDNVILDAFRIFNRWGELVFDNQFSYDGWDGSIQGKPQPSETYVYYISGKTVQQSTEFKRTGTISLIR